MSKVIKACLIGGSIYGALEFCYRVGQGQMLGSLAKNNVDANEMIEVLDEDKRLRLKLINYVAKRQKNREERP